MRRYISASELSVTPLSLGDVDPKAITPEDFPVRIERLGEGDSEGAIRLSKWPGSTARIFYAMEGPRPRLEDGRPIGETRELHEPVIVRDATVLRVMTDGEDLSSPIRSRILAPNLWTARLSGLPYQLRYKQLLRSKQLDGIYVTGDYCEWNKCWDLRNRLSPVGDGSYCKQVRIDGATRHEYKFAIRYSDGSIDWCFDPALPVRGGGDFRNNVVSPENRVREMLLADTDGMLEESLIKSQQIKIGDSHVRLILTLLEGDAESVLVKFPETPPRRLARIVYQRDGLTWTAFTALIKVPDTGLNTSYCYQIQDLDRTWTFQPTGLMDTTSRDDLAATGEPYGFELQIASKEKQNLDLRSRVIYFLVLDRFADGNPENNQGNNSPDSYDATRQNFQKHFGGDIVGLIGRLGYLRDLGIGAVWTTPLVNNADEIYGESKDRPFGYHGYWGMDFYQVDEHFGDWSDVIALSAAMKTNGPLRDGQRIPMQFILDFAPNHSSPAFLSGRLCRDGLLELRSHSADMENSLESRWYHHLGGMRPGDWQRPPHRMIREASGLADFRLEAEPANRYMLDAIERWLRAGVDAVRFDSLKHTDPGFVRRFVATIQAYDDQHDRAPSPIIGEWYDGGVNCAPSLDLVNDVNGLDLLDFGLATRLRESLGGSKTMRELGELVAQRKTAFLGRDDWQVTFLDNHDMQRIGTYLQDVETGAGLSQPVAERRTDLGMVLLLTLPGIPCIYYGTEHYRFDLEHREVDDNGWIKIGHEPYNREMMQDFEANTPVCEIIRELAKLRLNSPAVQRGEYAEHFADDDALVYERTLDGESVLVAVNRAATPRLLAVTGLALNDGRYENLVVEAAIQAGITDANGLRTVTVQNHEATLNLPPNGYAVLHSKRVGVQTP